MILESILSALIAQATQASACVEPEQYVATAATPEYPASVQKLATPKTVVLFVSITNSGAPVETFMQASSGDSLIDRAAFRAARETVYRPAKLGCGVFGKIAIKVTFDPKSPPKPVESVWPLPPTPPPPRLATLTVPSGWAQQSGMQMWTKGSANIIVAAYPGYALDSWRAQIEQGMKKAGVTPLIDQAIRICSNTQDGWKVSFAVGGRLETMVMADNGRGVYTAGYTGQGTTTPEDVDSALNSLCMP